tara:strand:+ start:166 stop:306 length:141 start_codon:yes stop_codon:yes gene_type:complete
MEEISNPLPFILFNFLIWIGLIALILYFLLKRVKDKKSEDFEDRDN